jgi:hypothetical protein
MKLRFHQLCALALTCCMVTVAQADENSTPEAVEKPTSVANKQLDRLDLDTTSIKGNQELPKVLYIVPWKQAGIGDLTGKPVNSLLDEVLRPLDRDVFRRQVRYFDQLYVTAEPVAEKD